MTLVTTAFALFTNLLVSRRIEQSLGRRRVPGMAGHVVVVGLGSVGIRVVEGLLAEGRQVVVVEHDDSNRYLGRARALGVPVVIGRRHPAPDPHHGQPGPTRRRWPSSPART